MATARRCCFPSPVCNPVIPCRQRPAQTLPRRRFQPVVDHQQGPQEDLLVIAARRFAAKLEAVLSHGSFIQLSRGTAREPPTAPPLTAAAAR